MADSYQRWLPPRTRKGRGFRGVSTTRQRLAAMLRRKARDLHPRCVAFEIEEHDLWSSRSPARRFDDQLGTWGGAGTAVLDSGERLTVCVASYETMTRCVRHGFVLSWRGKAFCSGVDATALE